MPLLEKRTCDNGVVCLVSPLLDQASIPHGFATRIGGVSSGAFASLNLGNPQGAIRDSEEHIHENYLRLFAGLRLSGRQLCRVHQVHGKEVLQLNRGDMPPAGHQADGLLTDSPEFTLSIRTADCVPVLIASRDGKVTAAVHAGWRGVVAGIVPRAISMMRARGIAAQDILLAIGPCIGPESFEVGEEVAAEFVKAFGDEAPVIRRGSAKPHVDLRQAIAIQGRRMGISPDRIDSTDVCTVRDADLFFSHRRDAGVTGRMASVISPRA